MCSHPFPDGEVLPGLRLIGADVLEEPEFPLIPLIDGGSRLGIVAGGRQEEAGGGDEEDLGVEGLGAGVEVLMVLHVVQARMLCSDACKQVYFTQGSIEPSMLNLHG